MDELTGTKIYDRDEIELTWRNEFDELGESGVRHEFFNGTLQADQRKEGFAYRWLGEKRKEQENTSRRRWRNIRVALNIFMLLVIAGVIVESMFPGLISYSFIKAGAKYLKV